MKRIPMCHIAGKTGRKGHVIIFPIKFRLTVIVSLFHSNVLKQWVAKFKI